MALGVNVSKANIYGVLSPPLGVNVSKAVVYAVIQPMDPGVNVSKALVYAVIHEAVASGGLLLNPDMRGGMRSMSGGFTI